MSKRQSRLIARKIFLANVSSPVEKCKLSGDHVAQQQTLQLQKGTNNKTVNVSALAKGTYVVKIVCTNGCEAAVRKFVKE